MLNIKISEITIQYFIFCIYKESKLKSFKDINIIINIHPTQHDNSRNTFPYQPYWWQKYSK